MQHGFHSHGEGRTSYDAVEYHAFPVAWQHLARMAAVAYLCGRPYRDPRRARVLDLACGQATTALVQAQIYPGCEIVAVDLAERQIANARALAHRVGLKNLRLEAANIMDLSRETHGEFDFIQCSGAFSWVPPEVQDHILRIFGTMLAPGGLAGVRFCVDPAFQFLSPVRDALLFHANRYADPEERLRQAGLLTAALRGGRMAQAPGVSGHLAHLAAASADPHQHRNFWHEHLGEFYAAHSISALVRQAAHHGLSYVGDAERFPLARHVRTTGAARLATLLACDDIEREQFLDHFLLRGARLAIFTTEAGPGQREILPERARDLLFRLPVKAHDGVDFAAGKSVTFQLAGGYTFAATDPAVKGAFAWLGKQDGEPFFSVAGLFDAAREVVRAAGGTTTPAQIAGISNALMQCWEIGTASPFLPFLGAFREASELAPCPFALPVSRAQAEREYPVAGPGFRHALLAPGAARLLTLCDGTRTIDQLRAEHAGLVRSGTITPAASTTNPKAEQERHFQETLNLFRRSGILAIPAPANR